MCECVVDVHIFFLMFVVSSPGFPNLLRVMCVFTNYAHKTERRGGEPGDDTRIFVCVYL